jgi:hypothetical protein
MVAAPGYVRHCYVRPGYVCFAHLIMVSYLGLYRIANLPDTGYQMDSQYPTGFPLQPDILYSPSPITSPMSNRLMTVRLMSTGLCPLMSTGLLTFRLVSIRLMSNRLLTIRLMSFGLRLSLGLMSIRRKC